MANRIPLIVDTIDDNKIKELPAGDNLDLPIIGGMYIYICMYVYSYYLQ